MFNFTVDSVEFKTLFVQNIFKMESVNAIQLDGSAKVKELNIVK